LRFGKKLDLKTQKTSLQRKFAGRYPDSRVKPEDEARNGRERHGGIWARHQQIEGRKITSGPGISCTGIFE